MSGHDMDNAIVVLGASGTVGVACVEALVRQGGKVIATGRDPDLLRTRLAHLDPSQIHVVALDLMADAPWPDEVCSRRYFVQCAGPSFQLTKRALSLILARCTAPGIVIDVGGDASDVAHWQAPLAAAGWLGIFGAGIQPGLVGVAIRALRTRFDAASSLRVTTFTGGLQPLTRAGLKEYLQAVNNRTGAPGLRLEKGMWHRAQTSPALPDAFPPSVQAHPFIDEEASLAAEDLGLLALTGYNITDSAELSHLLNGIMIAGEVSDAIEVRIADALADKKRWFSLSVEGRDDTQPQSGWRTTLSCSDSYQVTGEVAAWTAINIASGMPASNGACWFSRHPHALAIWTHWLTQPPPNVRIIWQKLLGQRVCEEGEL